MCVGGAGRQPPVPGGGLPGEEAGEPGIGPAARRGPVLAGGGAAAAAAALPPRPGPALPRLGRGNDLRGNLGRAGRERGRGGGAPGTLRRCPGDQRIQRGRPAGRWRPASPPPPALSCSVREHRGGPGAAFPGTRRCLRAGGSSACAARGAEARQQPGGVGVPGGLRWPRCPGQKASGAGGGGVSLRLGGDGTGVPGGW